MLPFERFEALTFDCYGTLIDWESGILNALRQVLSRHGIEAADDQILAAYAAEEEKAESGDYHPYREVLRKVMRGVGARFDFAPSDGELDHLAASIEAWPPFPDTIESLHTLKRRYRLAIVSNIDDDLFSGSARRLEVPFDEVITARQVRSYKPRPAHFEAALERLGVKRDRLLHVAQSLFHDIEPARRLGLSTVWVNRRQGREGFGATPPGDAKPDLEVPDLRTLVRLAVPAS
jgi:2-haloacid dehalogenase